MHVGCKTISFSTTISEMTYNTRTLSPLSSAFHRDADTMNALQGHITDLRFVYTGTHLIGSIQRWHATLGYFVRVEFFLFFHSIVYYLGSC